MTNEKVSNKEKLRSTVKDAEDSLSAIKGVFNGRTALVISAGPSARKWNDIYSKVKHLNPIICCVKQTINMPFLSDLCDIHFINPYNLQKYKRASDPFVVYSGDFDAPPSYQDWDICYEIIKSKDAGIKDTLAFKCNFDDYLLDVSGTNRPWGPGIMHESIIYTLVHMGVKKIHTVGWDIADNAGSNKHFYDANRKIDYEKSIYRIARKFLPKNLGDYFFYRAGKTYNRASMMKGEAEITSKSIPMLKDWLAEKSVLLFVHSDSEWMNKD